MAKEVSVKGGNGMGVLKNVGQVYKCFSDVFLATAAKLGEGSAMQFQGAEQSTKLSILHGRSARTAHFRLHGYTAARDNWDGRALRPETQQSSTTRQITRA